MKISTLQEKKLDELRALAREMDLSGYSKLRKQDLIYRILEAQAEGVPAPDLDNGATDASETEAPDAKDEEPDAPDEKASSDRSDSDRSASDRSSSFCIGSFCIGSFCIGSFCIAHHPGRSDRSAAGHPVARLDGRARHPDGRLVRRVGPPAGRRRLLLRVRVDAGRGARGAKSGFTATAPTTWLPTTPTGLNCGA